MTEPEISFKDYVDGRFDRLVASIEEKFKLLACELKELIAANDLRYQQRFDAQSKALDFAATAAKEAVNAALTGADKASGKTEQAADKRFLDLGELIKEQFKSIIEKYEAVAKKVGEVESRLNSHIDLASGGDKSKENVRALWAIVISVGTALLVVWKTFRG